MKTRLDDGRPADEMTAVDAVGVSSTQHQIGALEGLRSDVSATVTSDQEGRRPRDAPALLEEAVVVLAPDPGPPLPEPALLREELLLLALVLPPHLELLCLVDFYCLAVVRAIVREASPQPVRANLGLGLVLDQPAGEALDEVLEQDALLDLVVVRACVGLLVGDRVKGGLVAQVGVVELVGERGVGGDDGGWGRGCSWLRQRMARRLHRGPDTRGGENGRAERERRQVGVARGGVRAVRGRRRVRRWKGGRGRELGEGELGRPDRRRRARQRREGAACRPQGDLGRHVGRTCSTGRGVGRAGGQPAGSMLGESGLKADGARPKSAASTRRSCTLI